MNGGAAGWRRVPAWGPPALVCAVFLLAGVATLDDYGVMANRAVEYEHVRDNANYILGRDHELYDYIDKLYGPIFEFPILIGETLIHLDDAHDRKLIGNFLVHLFFTVSGLFCYLLVYRLFNSRIIAILVMILFLLHPRIYAHSFFNTRDLPFLSMFMISLYLVHRSFRNDTVFSFLLLGISVGILINLRPMGIAMFAAILSFRALDATRTKEKRSILSTSTVFILASALTLYATMPYLWIDTVNRTIEVFTTLSRFPIGSRQLFNGEIVFAQELPRDYLPVWFMVTTPPVLLALGLLGAGLLFWRSARRPRVVLHDTVLRFGLLVVACFAVPIIAVIVLRPTMYDGWRHMYFLHAPFTILAAFALYGLTSLVPPNRARIGIHVLAGFGILVMILSIVRIHPYQGSYFNLLTDRTTPDSLSSRFVVDYFYYIPSDIVARIARDHPVGELYFGNGNDIPSSIWAAAIPAHDRRNVVRRGNDISGDTAVHFAILTGEEASRAHSGRFAGEGVWTHQLYNNQVVAIVPNWFANARREALADEPLARSGFDVYRDGRVLTYVRDECSPDDASARFFLHVFPVVNADLPGYRQRHGFDNLDFPLGARIDGNCVGVALLPDYPVARIRTGQFSDDGTRWEVAIAFDDDGAAIAPPDYASARMKALAGEPPLARSGFDVYVDGRTLTYVRDGCTEAEAAALFFLHVRPSIPDDLPEHRREHGFDNLDFTLAAQGARIDGDCVAVALLPAYAIARVETGQYDATGRLWTAEFGPLR